MSMEGITLPSWPAALLHKVVAHFMRVRFPILIALNKCDSPRAAANIERVKQAWPWEPCVATSALGELLLLNLRAAGLIQYEAGDSSFTILPALSTKNAVVSTAAKASGIQNSQFAEAVIVLDRLKTREQGTGVTTVLSLAVSLRHPIFVYPVCDYTTFSSLSKPGAISSALRECIMMHKGSTIATLFSTLKVMRLVEGEYTYSEALLLSQILPDQKVDPASIKSHVLRKEDVVGDVDTTVVRMMPGARSILYKRFGR